MADPLTMFIVIRKDLIKVHAAQHLWQVLPRINVVAPRLTLWIHLIAVDTWMERWQASDIPTFFAKCMFPGRFN
jgi:hypothetical protein